MKKYTKILIAALVLIILIAGGFFAWQYFGAPKEIGVTSNGKEKEATIIDKDIGKAVELVRGLPEVKEWLALFSGSEGTSPTTGGKPAVEFDHKEGDKYMVHAYEVVPTDGHTATFNWYTVDLVMGEIRNFFGDIVFIVKDETADWETYRNEEFGFEVKHPPDGIVTERSKDFIDIETSGPRLFSIQIVRDRILSQSSLPHTATFYRDGHTVFLSDAFYTADSPIRKFQPIEEEIFDQMLSTFKFLE